jgi:hypothetical protein
VKKKKKKLSIHKSSKGRKTKSKIDSSRSFDETSSSMTSDIDSAEYQISRDEAQLIVKSCQELLRY